MGKEPPGAQPGGEPPAEEPGGEPSADFDWSAPRWREPDEVQGDVERSRRLWSDRAPRQRGALDEAGSVDGRPAPMADDAPELEPDEGESS
jgi:hypothetical protein